MDRLDRVADEADAEEFVEQEKLTMDVEVNRQPVPEPSDGEVCTCGDVKNHGGGDRMVLLTSTLDVHPQNTHLSLDRASSLANYDLPTTDDRSYLEEATTPDLLCLQHSDDHTPLASLSFHSFRAAIKRADK